MPKTHPFTLKPQLSNGYLKPERVLFLLPEYSNNLRYAPDFGAGMI